MIIAKECRLLFCAGNKAGDDLPGSKWSQTEKFEPDFLSEVLNIDYC
jgi:hypothetical protein